MIKSNFCPEAFYSCSFNKYTLKVNEYGDSWLHYIALQESASIFLYIDKDIRIPCTKNYIKHSPDVKNNDGDTIWHYLAWSGNYEVLCKAIDDKRFDSSITNNDGNTVWHYLASSKCCEMIHKAIDDKRFDPIIKNNSGNTVWHYLAQTNNYEALCKAIDEKLCDPKITNNDGWNLWELFVNNCDYNTLCKAIDDKRFDTQRFVLNCLEPGYIGNDDDDYISVWYYLAEANNYRTLCKAIDSKKIDKNRDAVWHDVMYSGNYKMLQKLHKRYKFNRNIFERDEWHLFTELSNIDILEQLSEKLKTMEIPINFKCSISHNLMTDPVTIASGQIYDRHFIEKWLTQSDNDPSTGQRLSHREVNPDLRTRKEIENWLQTL